MNIDEWKRRCLAYVRSDSVTPEHLEELASAMLFASEEGKFSEPLDEAIAAYESAPRTITGNGQPPPDGLWLRSGKYSKEEPYFEACAGPTCRTVPGVTYTYVGPVPAAEQEETKP